LLVWIREARRFFLLEISASVAKQMTPSTRCENNFSEGRVAPQNSFVSISLVNSNPILSRSFPSSIQSFSKTFKGH
jgi:hypothetical protein